MKFSVNLGDVPIAPEGSGAENGFYSPTLEQFKLAFSKQETALRANMRVYCLCGREFPNGVLSRVLSFAVIQYADNRCPVCVEWHCVREAIALLGDLKARNTSDGWRTLHNAEQHLWTREPESM